MASDHSTGNSRPVKIPTERQLTVGTLFYEYPPGEDGTPRRSRRVPWLQMPGDWLSAVGFDIRAPVRVQVMRGRLVLTVEES